MSYLNEKNILPFAISSREDEDVDENLEKAAVFCFAEMSREKGGGFLRKQSGEKLVFVSKVFYPFWLVPFRELTFLIDGLNAAAHIIPYSVLPDLKSFKTNLNGKKTDYHIHLNFLSDNQNYFQISNEEKKLEIEGLLNDAEFTEEFLEYSKEAKQKTVPVTDAVFVSPSKDKDAIIDMLEKVENQRLKFLEDIADLSEIIKLLNLRSQEAQFDLREQIRLTEEKFGAKIKKVKAVVDDSVAKLNKAYTNEVKEISSNYGVKITALQTEVVKFEKSKELLEADIERVESEIKTAAINKDDTAEGKWKEKRSELKDKRPELDSNLKQLKKEILSVEDDRKNELFQLKQKNDSEINEAKRDLYEVEAARDAEVKVYQNEIEKIEELTSNIIVKVDELAKNRERIVIEFDALSVKQKRQEYSLIYMPLYLACYQAKAQKRYGYVAPSVVSSGGFSARLKSLGKTKISQFFQLRYKKTILILNNFIKLLDEDVVFSRETFEACLKTNMLQGKNQEAILEGLGKLKEQDWLSSREFEEFSEAVS
ncbi:MAG: hypothetical protein NWE92_05090 [Candidatus Bathyarchaeota archaeon]|nr:hypothetical protein [Candidatus Bathyarchaeota archaeon]